MFIRDFFLLSYNDFDKAIVSLVRLYHQNFLISMGDENETNLKKCITVWQ